MLTTYIIGVIVSFLVTLITMIVLIRSYTRNKKTYELELGVLTVIIMVILTSWLGLIFFIVNELQERGILPSNIILFRFKPKE